MSITTLSPRERRALLTRLLREKDHQPKTAPLSFAQERLWFLDQLEPNNPSYNMPAAVRLAGHLDVAALVQSLNEIVRRHETLRTTFAATNGRPVQVIAPCLTLPLPLIDLRLLPAAGRQVQARRLIAAEARYSFDLAQGPLLRALLLRLAAEEHILILNVYHIVSDGWSQDVLLRELIALYAAFSQHRLALLPELPLQYADYARWQREWLQGEVLERQLDYWQGQLANAPPVLELPTDRPRPPAQTFRGARQSLTLSPSLGQALKALSQRQGVTLFVTSLAAFKVLLYRYTGQSDLVVGSPIAGRNRAELEGLIGFFANTLALRTALFGDLTFQELLARVREVVLGAQAHQDLPFETLVERLQLSRDLSRTPLFQVMFILQESPARFLELPELTLSLVEVDSGTAKFDLTLIVQDTTPGLKAILEYNTDLFDASTISRMLGHFQHLLQGVVAADAGHQQRLYELPLLTEAERQQLLAVWNDLHTNYPQDRCIHELFEDQVEETPDAVAVVFAATGSELGSSTGFAWQHGDNQHLTYRALNRRANQLAHYLQGLGVRPEVPVSICMERSVEIVVGILGVLKAGGVYVPLDLVHLKERLAFILEDIYQTEPKTTSVLLTQQHLVKGLPNFEGQVICLDTDWMAVAQENCEQTSFGFAQSEKNPAGGATPGNQAYIIYTSGSTGKPKGVMVSHYNVTRLFEATQSWYHFDEKDVWTLFHSYAFDFSVWEIWGALLHGGRLVIVSYPVSRSPDVFHDLLCAERVTVLNQTPLAFRQLVRVDESAKAVQNSSLRLVILGGEALEPGDLGPWYKPRLVNMYGITETTVHVTYYPLVLGDVSEALGSVIGRPIPDLQVYLLDWHLQPVPIGVPAEIHVGGAGLSRGYLNRPALTAERFIPDPFSPRPGARLYRSGDLGRYLPSGDIEYLGRIDHQVKIRGFRIELGDIEAALGQHPLVQETVVLAQDTGGESGEKRLVAYVVTVDGQELTVSELRRFVKARLPDYMVPSVFVMLEALPLTPNGKVDRKALPTPTGARPELKATFVAPLTPAEKKLAQIWAYVLGLEQVGVHDNFFELGGDSILSIQVIARANQAGLQLVPRQLFEYQTIAELATVAGTAPDTSAGQEVVTGEVPLTPIQYWFFEQDLSTPHHFNQALLLQVQHPLDAALLERAFEQLLVHHDALRLRFERQLSGWQQLDALPDGSVPFTWIDLTALSEAPGPALEAAAASLQASLNLERGPLARMAFFELGVAVAGRLLVVIHHLAVDGVSWRILLQDLWTVYQQLERGDEVQLPPKTTSFKQWAERLVAYAQTSELQREGDYWTDESRTQVPRLPLDHDTGDNEVASSATVSVSLSAQETHALLHEVPAACHTHINDVLLTALAQAFAQWTGVPSLLVDLESHGRETPFEDLDLSRSVGWFTSVAPLLLDLSAAWQPGEALMSVKEQLRRVPAAGIGYGLLHYLGQNEGLAVRLRALPQAEVSFNYLGQIEQGFSTALPFQLAPEWAGPPHDPQTRRRYLLEVNGSVAAGQLQLGWRYSQNRHRRSTVEQLAQTFIASLQALIAHCQSPQAGGHTVSDFPAAEGLDQQELDELLAEFGEFGGD